MRGVEREGEQGKAERVLRYPLCILSKFNLAAEDLDGCCTVCLDESGLLMNEGYEGHGKDGEAALSARSVMFGHQHVVDEHGGDHRLAGTGLDACDCVASERARERASSCQDAHRDEASRAPLLAPLTLCLS